MSLDCLERRLASLDQSGLLRDPEDALVRDQLAASNPGFLDLSSNDYLGFARRDVSRETSCPPDPPGSGASRLIHGTRAVHQELEAAVATWTHQPTALLYSSGYAANLGLISAIAHPDDRIFSDALNHASIIDGCRLSRAPVSVYAHLDIEHLSNLLSTTPVSGARWVVTESYFSMDGDSPDLPRLAHTCAKYGAHLVLDEAHALGVFGPEGAGLARASNITPDILVGTFGKAVGTAGAFVAGPQSLRTWLWNRSRSFVYSTAPSPTQSRTTLRHVDAVRAADARRSHLSTLCKAFQHAATTLHLPVDPRLPGPIFPVLVGSLNRLSAAVSCLRAAGLLTQGIRPPTVPPETARLRITLSSLLSLEDIPIIAQALARACEDPERQAGSLSF